ncbi:hypothetical protein CERZMDRAFT_82917 [Cercospora zeae-maydis SCOH1-5]|uniref:Uncharacterized protein n=1 Tax=Cercospora zeae-maydis SCOH1-5 TaxID=717836 RepID=A0A6A6FP13_9PEZI|nr:hypothetical protein CERZMDRAFT_82917 [Cercospora zeae-maydis SCOH1-5]
MYACDDDGRFQGCTCRKFQDLLSTFDRGRLSMAIRRECRQHTGYRDVRPTAPPHGAGNSSIEYTAVYSTAVLQTPPISASGNWMSFIWPASGGRERLSVSTPANFGSCVFWCRSTRPVQVQCLSTFNGTWMASHTCRSGQPGLRS